MFSFFLYLIDMLLLKQVITWSGLILESASLWFLKTCFSRSHSRSGRMTLSSSCYETPEPEALKGESTLASGGEAGEQKFVLK